MFKKRNLILIIIVFLLTGCTKVDSNFDNIVSATMSNSSTYVNTASTNYKLYVPIGVVQLVDNEYNQKFKIRDNYVYLYVDTVSYYYKYKLNYDSDGNYNHYYKSIIFNDKFGYVGINKLENDSYFCEIVYNYSKVEFYSDEEDLPILLSNSLIILNSIEYNDKMIKLELDNDDNSGRELSYELDKPSDSESTFSQVLQEYVEPEETDVVLPDSE